MAYLSTTHSHRLYYQITGRPDGLPLLFLHGGPGSGCNPEHARWLYPAQFQIVQFDQRGCGLSEPQGDILHNTLELQLADIELLRETLGFERWVVYGGSWGATLALEYAKAQPERVAGLLLRGAFLARQEDWEWFSLPRGAAQKHPQAYQDLLRVLDCTWGDDPGLCLKDHLQAENIDPAQAYAYALAWDVWEAQLMGLPAPKAESEQEKQQRRINAKRIFTHYAAQQFFLGTDGVLADLDKLHNIPGAIVHGQADLVCRASGAELLAEQLPDLQAYLVDAGHGLHDEAMQQALLSAAKHLYLQLQHE